MIIHLVLLEKNPLENIHNTRCIKIIIYDGKVFTRQILDRLLTHVEEKAQN